MKKAAQPPPLPPKIKNFNLPTELPNQTNVDNISSICTHSIPTNNDNDSGPDKPCQNETIDDYLPLHKATWITTIHSRNEKGPTKMATWADKDETCFGDVYENLSNATLYVLNKCPSPGREKNATASGGNQLKERQRKTPKVEVCQQDFKTVVKISVKDSSTKEDEVKRAKENKSPDLGFGNAYENGHVRTQEFRREGSHPTRDDDQGIYENVFASECENEQVDYQNVFAINCLYANLNENVGRLDRRLSVPQTSSHGSPKVIIPSKRYACNVEEEDDVYENVVNGNSVYAIERFYHDDERNSDGESFNECEPGGKRRTALSEITFTRTAEVKERAKGTEVNAFKDPFDSETSSDVDNLPATFLNARKGNVIVTIKSFHGDEQKREEGVHKRAESLTSSGLGADSDESDDDKSNISCDSLNSSEPYTQSNSEDHGYHTPILEDKTGSPVETTGYDAAREQINSNQGQTIEFDHESATSKLSGEVSENSQVDESSNPKSFTAKEKASPPLATQAASIQPQGECEEDGQKCLPKSLLRDIESRTVRLSSTFPNGEGKENVKNSVAQVILCLESNANLKNGEVQIQKPKPTVSASDKKPLILETTYEDQNLKNKNVLVNQICAMEVDTDKFYRFHISENCREEKGADDETFAGIKDYLSKDRASAITSAKGTIRGVKNRVKAGIATFLQMHENKSYKNRDAGKVVVYTTTMGIVRETYHKCLKVKQILGTLMVKFEERDVFMSAEAQEDIRARMKCNAILVPQVFVEGQHIGDAETIERLNEMGELRTIMKPYKSLDACSTCKVCGGYRLLPCSVCKGSKKSVHRNHFTAGFVSLKCMNCDQVGLVRCHAC